jgi:hypothetical protein
MMSRIRCSRRWKKWSAPGTTTTGRSFGWAQAKTLDQRHQVIVRAVDDDGVVRHGLGVVVAGAFHVAGGGADQHQALGRMAGFAQALGDARLAVGAEGEAGQRHRQVAAAALGVFEHGQQVVGFAAAFVMDALGAADATEIRAEGGVAEADEGARQRVGDLVGIGAAAHRVRMGDQGDAARRVGAFHDDVDLAGRAVDEDFSSGAFMVRSSGGRRRGR